MLADPSGELTDLQDRLTTYPPALIRALVGRLEEAYFLLGGSEKSARRADVLLVGFTVRAHAILRSLGTDSVELGVSLTAARALLDEVAAACKLSR